MQRRHPTSLLEFATYFLVSQMSLSLLSLVRSLVMLVVTAKMLRRFTFMLPGIVIDIFLNNQPDALTIQICSVIKLYIFRAFSLPIIRSFLLYIRHW